MYIAPLSTRTYHTISYHIIKHFCVEVSKFAFPISCHAVVRGWFMIHVLVFIDAIICLVSGRCTSCAVRLPVNTLRTG
jgi:hypothetical protein